MRQQLVAIIVPSKGFEDDSHGIELLLEILRQMFMFLLLRRELEDHVQSVSVHLLLDYLVKRFPADI